MTVEIEGLLQTDAVDALNTDMGATSSITQNSVNDHVHRSTGHKASKVITLGADETTASENIFQVTGTVQIIKLYAIITDASTLVNCTGAFFELDAGGAQTEITNNDGVLSGMAVGTFMVKNGLATETMAVANNATAVLTEQALDKRVYQSCVITQMLSTATYIRFTYTTTDSPIDAQITVYCEFLPVSDGTSTLVAV